MNATRSTAPLNRPGAETLNILLPGGSRLTFHAFPSVHHRYPHIPVIRVESNGMFTAYGQFTTTGGKIIRGCGEPGAENTHTTLRREIERMLDQYPEAKPHIVRLKTSKGPHIAKGNQTFLVKFGRKQGVLDIYGTFFPLLETEWETAA